MRLLPGVPGLAERIAAIPTHFYLGRPSETTRAISKGSVMSFIAEENSFVKFVVPFSLRPPKELGQLGGEMSS